MKIDFISKILACVKGTKAGKKFDATQIKQKPETLTSKSFNQEIEEYQTGNDTKRPNYYLQKIIFNDGSEIDINKNDIIILVGENNVGKSRALQDLYDLLALSQSSTVVKGIENSKPLKDDLLQWCRLHLTVKKQDTGESYSGIGVKNISDFDITHGYDEKTVTDSIRNVLACKLNSYERLSISGPVQSDFYLDLNNNPIKALLNDELQLKRVSAAFYEAFGMFIFPNMGTSASPSLCVYDKPDIQPIKHESQIEFQSKYTKIMNSIPKLHEQGDGMRCFMGLLLYLIIERYNIYLIDEPEAFLHPPQATLLGGMVGDLLNGNRQAIIATHSLHFLKGLLDKHSNRVKIIRITRSKDTNSFNLLNNERISKISNDSFLKHSSLLEGMFYKNVVLCESDVDCMFYSMLNSAIDLKGARGADTLFIHCGGKHRMEKVLWALKELKVDVKVVTDFDVLNDREILKKLVEACGGTWDLFEDDYKVLDLYIKGQSRKRIRWGEFLETINSKFAEDCKNEISSEKAHKIRELLGFKTLWDDLKNEGIDGIKQEDARNAAESILERLKCIGLFIVPCGELEQFVPGIEGHSTSWLNNVIEQNPDLSSDVYKKAKDFIRELNL